MNRKIIGTVILISGLLLMAAIVYFAVNSGLFSFSWLDFWKSKDLPDSSVSYEDSAREEKSETRPAGDEAEKKVISPSTAPEESEEKDESGEILPAGVSGNEFGKDDIIRMASSFAERFGSYSNQSNFNNVTDLKIFMTDKMKNWADSYIMKNRQQPTDSKIYFGITTKTIGAELKEYDDDVGTAEALVTTRRREAISARKNVSNVFTQDILITFRKEKGSWKVDSAFWRED